MRDKGPHFGLQERDIRYFRHDFVHDLLHTAARGDNRETSFSYLTLKQQGIEQKPKNQWTACVQPAHGPTRCGSSQVVG